MFAAMAKMRICGFITSYRFKYLLNFRRPVRFRFGRELLIQFHTDAQIAQQLVHYLGRIIG